MSVRERVRDLAGRAIMQLIAKPSRAYDMSHSTRLTSFSACRIETEESRMAIYDREPGDGRLRRASE